MCLINTKTLAERPGRWALMEESIYSKILLLFKKSNWCPDPEAKDSKKRCYHGNHSSKNKYASKLPSAWGLVGGGRGERTDFLQIVPRASDQTADKILYCYYPSCQATTITHRLTTPNLVSLNKAHL